jgi:ADP-heptose:LPS heptosyltransferase
MLIDLSKRDDIGSLLIVRLKALGDIVLSLPIIAALREHFPEAWIGYLCWGEYAESLSGDTGLDDVVILPKRWLDQAGLMRRLRRRKIDVVLDLLSSPRSAVLTRMTGGRILLGMDVGRHRWCYHHVLPRAIMRCGRIVKRYTMVSNWEIVRLLGLEKEYARLVGTACGSADLDLHTALRAIDDPQIAKTFDLGIGFPAAERERRWAREYVAALGIPPQRIVGIAPGATYRSKSWPVERFIALSKMLMNRRGLTPLLLWGPGEDGLARGIAEAVPGSILAPSTGIARLGALLAELPVLVTLDTGPKHIAVLVGTPTVTLFGPTDPEYWDPLTDTHVAIHHPMECFPCRNKACEPNRCLVDIGPEEVFEAMEGVLQV